MEDSLCGFCSENHAPSLACFNAREQLENNNLCDFCNERKSNLRMIFEDSDMPKFSECTDLLDKQSDNHLCAEKIKCMIMDGDRAICMMCKRNAFPGTITPNGLNSVQFVDFVHCEYDCIHFCIYCFKKTGGYNNHLPRQCKMVNHVDKSIIDERHDDRHDNEW